MMTAIKRAVVRGADGRAKQSNAASGGWHRPLAVSGLRSSVNRDDGHGARPSQAVLSWHRFAEEGGRCSCLSSRQWSIGSAFQASDRNHTRASRPSPPRWGAGKAKSKEHRPLWGSTLGLSVGGVEISVAVLAHSGLIYAKAVPEQRSRHWANTRRASGWWCRDPRPARAVGRSGCQRSARTLPRPCAA